MARSQMITRAQRRIPAIIVATVLAVCGFIAAWAGVEGLLRGELPGWLAWLPEQLSRRTFGSLAFIAICLGTTLVGLVLIIAALKPGRRSGLSITAPKSHETTQCDVVLSRRGLARLSGARAAQVDGADQVSVSAGDGSVAIGVRSSASDTKSVQDAVAAGVRDRLGEVGFTRPPRVSAKVRRAG